MPTFHTSVGKFQPFYDSETAQDFPPYLLIRLRDMTQLIFTSVDYMCASAKSLQ